MPTVVIKYGGHAMDKPELSEAFAADLTRLAAQGMRLVVVHGGGPQISALLNRLHVESRFVNGLRVTDAACMEAVEMVLCGQVNKAVVSALARHGARAAGISGRDGNLLLARRKHPDLGLVGDVEAVDPSLPRCLLDAGFVPVIAPVASGSEGEALNINADTAAGALAGALEADYFVLISDVPGVLDAQGRLISGLSRAEITRLIDQGVISGGMIPKVEACLNALDAGCGRALILDGRAVQVCGGICWMTRPWARLWCAETRKARCARTRRAQDCPRKTSAQPQRACNVLRPRQKPRFEDGRGSETCQQRRGLAFFSALQADDADDAKKTAEHLPRRARPASVRVSDDKPCGRYSPLSRLIHQFLSTRPYHQRL